LRVVAAHADGPHVVIDLDFELHVGLYYNGAAPKPGSLEALQSPQEHAPASEGVAGPQAQKAGPAEAPPRLVGASDVPPLAVAAMVAAPLGGAAIVAGALRGQWAWLAGWRLFSRLREDDVLRHPRRALLMEAVEQRPGVNVEALRRVLGWSKGSFEHHLAVLVRAGRVRRRRVEGFVCLDAGAGGDVPVTKGSPLGARVMVELARRPGLTQTELAAALDVPAGRVGYHVRRLARSGRLRRQQDGRSVRCFPVA
jgi:DNA-binding MarR family transcriptional regulator